MKIEVKQSRREILKTAGLAAAAVGLSGTSAFAISNRRVRIPQWNGFNLLDFFSPDPANPWPATEEEYLKWMQDWGFDFVRIPMAYP